MPTSRVVLSWGPPRMGTTWLFNVLQAIASQSGTPMRVVADQLEPPSASWTGSVILKSHRADPPELVAALGAGTALLACVMVRDAVPTFRSLIRTQTAPREELLGWLESDLDSYEAVLPTMAHVAVIREEWISDQAALIVFRLAAFTGMQLSTQQCEEIASSLDRESVRQQVKRLEESAQWQGDFRNFDRSSQWHAGHIAPTDQPELETSPTEQARLTALQARIDSLADTFPLWEARDLAPADTTCQPAMAYIQARRELLEPRPPLFARMRAALVRARRRR